MHGKGKLEHFNGEKAEEGKWENGVFIEEHKVSF
jgi:hypothetical protein